MGRQNQIRLMGDILNAEIHHMASICNDDGGRRRIQFSDTDGKRKTVRLGKCTINQARAIQSKMEELLTAKRLGTSLSTATAIWLNELEPELAGKLERVGLIVTEKR